MALQVYRDDGGMLLIQNHGSVQHLSPDYVEALERIEREQEDKRPHLHPIEVASLFPEGREYLVAKQEEIAVNLRELREREDRVNQRLVLHKDKPLKDEMLRDIAMERESLEYEKSQVAEMLSFFGKRGAKLRDFKEEILKAKQYPINQLVQFKHGGKAVCLWHNDKNPSMHYYPKKNKVYCFACNQGGDAVDVVMKLRDCSLKDAVVYLNGL
jgi:hypothetical protein